MFFHLRTTLLSVKFYVIVKQNLLCFATCLSEPVILDLRVLTQTDWEQNLLNFSLFVFLLLDLIGLDHVFFLVFSGINLCSAFRGADFILRPHKIKGTIQFYYILYFLERRLHDKMFWTERWQFPNVWERELLFMSG